MGECHKLSGLYVHIRRVRAVSPYVNQFGGMIEEIINFLEPIAPELAKTLGK